MGVESDPRQKFENEGRSLNTTESFGKRLQVARKKAALSQDEMAARLGLTRGVIASYELEQSAPDPVRAVHMARILGARPDEFLLLAIAQRSASDPDREGIERLRRTIGELLGGRGPDLGDRDTPGQPTTLQHFPGRFSPLAVVVGDRRETEPKNIGDLAAFSASPVDDRWLPALGLHKTTEKVSDKVFVTAPREWLEEQFGKKHLLAIGSPAANLFTRRFNDCFLFRFATTREAQRMMLEQEKLMGGDMSPAELLSFSERARMDLRQTMRLFKQPGFLDFTFRHLKVGIDPAANRDFAVVSLGRNPFAKPEDRFYCILAAGVHHPGTAHAVKFLAKREEFEHHPYGGVLEVQVPRDIERSEVKWYEKIGKSEAHWHSAGDSKERPYTPQALRRSIEQIREKVLKGDLMTDFDIAPEELQGHLDLIDTLLSGPGISLRNS